MPQLGVRESMQTLNALLASKDCNKTNSRSGRLRRRRVCVHQPLRPARVLSRVVPLLSSGCCCSDDSYSPHARCSRLRTKRLQTLTWYLPEPTVYCALAPWVIVRLIYTTRNPFVESFLFFIGRLFVDNSFSAVHRYFSFRQPVPFWRGRVLQSTVCRHRSPVPLRYMDLQFIRKCEALLFVVFRRLFFCFIRTAEHRINWVRVSTLPIKIIE